MARFLARDPSHVYAQAWVCSGTTMVLVTAEQLRVASGFERWQPSRDDIAALKDGSQSIRDSIWSDETGPAPPDAPRLPICPQPQPAELHQETTQASGVTKDAAAVQGQTSTIATPGLLTPPCLLHL